MNLSHLKILDDHRRDAELNPLTDIGICGLHTIHNSFKHGNEGTTSASKSDFPLGFCFHRWIENDIVAKSVFSI